MRRADAGVDTVSVNGGPAVGGSLSILSPMATFIAPSTIRVDNGNEFNGSAFAPPIASAQIDTELHNSFRFDISGAGPFTIAPPLAVTAGVNAQGRKITFALHWPNGGVGFQPVIFDTASAGGYQFADPTGIGPTLADFNGLQASLPGFECFLLIGFEYHSLLTGIVRPWVCCALSGWYQ